MAAAIDGCSNVLGIDGEYGDNAARGTIRAWSRRRMLGPIQAGRGRAIGSSDRVDSGSEDVIVDVVSDVRVPCETPHGRVCRRAARRLGADPVRVQPRRRLPDQFHRDGSDRESSRGRRRLRLLVHVSTPIPRPPAPRESMATKYGDDNTCASTGVSLNVPNANCQGINSNIRGFYSSTPLPPVIACTASTVTNDSNVTSTAMRQCSVPTNCREEICNGEVPQGFSACIVRTGTSPVPRVGIRRPWSATGRT